MIALVRGGLVRGVLCVALVVGCSGCGRNTPIGRFLRTLREVGDVLEWLCPLLFAIVFLGGGLASIVKTVRAPTSRSRAVATVWGAINLLVGVFFVISMLSDPPHARVEQTVPTGEVEEVFANGQIQTRPITETREVPGPVNMGHLVILLGIGLGTAALGGAGIWVARKSKAP